MGAKLHAPRLRPATVDRRDLLEVLSVHPGDVLLVAPPGFGKTTLLGQWQRADARPFAWVSLDAGDNDPVVLWRYVAEAIRGVEPTFAAGVEGALAVPGTDVLRGVVPRILNELGSLDRELVLVLEDYHWIDNPVCHESLDLFLEHGSPNVQLVVSSRRDPPLSLGRRRAGPHLLEFRAADLGFSGDETGRFLNGVLGLELSPEAVAVLRERTEGWPAGLYLAYLSLRSVADREAFVAEFHGSSRHVVDYLTEVVMTALDSDSRAFLLETSILERLCGPLCDAVTGHADSSARLLELERANLFLVPLDDHREWYRYHRLFIELLRDELVRRDPQRIPELHRRASAWHEAAGDVDAAIRHALAAGELEDASRLVAAHYLLALEWGGAATVARWLEAFPRSFVATDARLSIVEAWVMGFLNRRAESDRALENALAATYEGPLPDGASSMEASAALLRAGLPWGDVGRMLGAARRAFELEGHAESMWRVTAHVQLGWALSLSGAFAEARPLLEEATALAPLTEQWLNAFGARCLLAWIDLEDDRLEDAERGAREALEVLQTHGLSGSPSEGWARATLGSVLARRGRLEEADELLAWGVEHLRAGAQPLLLAQGLIAWASVRRALGTTAEARRLLDEAGLVVRDCPDPGVLGPRFEEATRTLTPRYRHVEGSELTERELEVLRLLEKGLSKREAASTLFLSYNTIHSHTRSIYRKLGAVSRAEAVERAQDQGLL